MTTSNLQEVFWHLKFIAMAMYVFAFHLNIFEADSMTEMDHTNTLQNCCRAQRGGTDIQTHYLMKVKFSIYI